MSVFSAFDICATGMTAQRTRLDIISQNIANVNTIIILDADHFGLSQLYQIRGRVGRSDKIAYAYLMYKPARLLTETATKRLESIKEFTELGSGYK